LNVFPQFYELYFKRTINFTKSFTRGRIEFGRPRWVNGNQKNLHAFEEYSGKGWQLGGWNVFDKVDWASRGEEGNARLGKIMFGTIKQGNSNPDNYFDYEINVKNGVYRIRAEVGDVEQESWQKIVFEGLEAGTIICKAGEKKWTNEKVVRINDRRITVRIYVDTHNAKVAGLSQLVFQRAY
jgi:hypothetical protein